MTPSQERLRRYWDDQAARFDAMIAPVERRFLSASRAWAAERARGAVLEVAVGTGLNLPYYGADARVTAVELSDGMLDGARHRAAMHAVQKPRLGHFAQVAADGLQGYIEPMGQIVDQNPTLGAGKIKDFVLADAQGQRLLLAG